MSVVTVLGDGWKKKRKRVKEVLYRVLASTVLKDEKNVMM